MLNKPLISVIIPAFNESKNIISTIKSIQSYLMRKNFVYEIIVAADGDDGTRELVRDYSKDYSNIQVIGSVERRGKGRGIREGVALAHGGIIGFVDADYKTPIEELDKLLPFFEQDYDVVIASRNVASSEILVPQPLYRQLGSKAFALAMHCLIGLWSIRDTQCGFKFFRADVAHDLFERQQIDGYMFDVEILFLANYLHYKVKEVGVRWQDDGDSRLDLVAGNWKNLKDILRIRFTPVRARQAPQVDVSEG